MLGQIRGLLVRRERHHVPDAASEVSAALGGLDGPIVLLAGRRTLASLPLWRKQFGDRLQMVVSQDWAGIGLDAGTLVRSRGEIRQVLSSTPPAAAIIDDSGDDPKALVERWQEFFLYLRMGGVYSMPQIGAGQAWTLVGGALRARRSDERVVTELIESMAPRPEALTALVSKSREHVRMIREDEAETILAARHPELDVQTLTTRPGGTWQSVTSMQSHNAGEEVDRLPPARFDYPELRLRSYQGGVVLGERMLAFAPGSLLPPSFNHPRANGLLSRRATDIDGVIARAPKVAEHLEAVEGPVFELNCALPGHFGHVVTESLAKLWAWDDAVARFPDLRAVYHLPPGDTEPSFEGELFQGAGVPLDRIIWARRDIRCDYVLSATLGWQNRAPRYAHPAMLEVWRGLRERLATEPSPVSDRIFVSRSGGVENRSCRNTAEVERFFQTRGFDVIYPEKLTVAEQASVFAGARVIAGFAGSAMFNMYFARKLECAIVLSHTSYTAKNEWLYAGLLADELHYFWSPADIPHAGRFSEKAFHSGWEFDFDANAAELDAVLRAT